MRPKGGREPGAPAGGLASARGVVSSILRAQECARHNLASQVGVQEGARTPKNPRSMSLWNPSLRKERGRAGHPRQASLFLRLTGSIEIHGSHPGRGGPDNQECWPGCHRRRSASEGRGKEFRVSGSCSALVGTLRVVCRRLCEGLVGSLVPPYKNPRPVSPTGGETRTGHPRAVRSLQPNTESMMRRWPG